ncbi:DUF3180 domain-containing protein [Arthrobacter sp. zg-Y859]|uniref:DUF3180 domain-containing protein n=1 Tax=Arthrobacter jinronghuae TaxID=2964609 RepID=A0ABT1NL32_9MICC|nr:DUF3180 domain-containing protein [Arthrobacter jinronghuae]MCQ1948428.1 DUF3180 domain-containing protein [Arthrobacter jinronghuae]UWX78743.1 DUF3180 domain-containing protein [Arthrobacter jinronghuae]
MSSIQYRWLAVIGLVAGVVGWAANFFLSENGYPAPVLSSVALVAIILVAGATLFLGLRVRSWRNGRRDRNLDPLAAARTVVLAQALAYAGALLLGWHAAIFLTQLPLWSLRPGHAGTWSALAVSVGGILMIATGLIVERFCKLPPVDKDGTGPGSGGGAGNGTVNGTGDGSGDGGEYA